MPIVIHNKRLWAFRPSQWRHFCVMRAQFFQIRPIQCGATLVSPKKTYPTNQRTGFDQLQNIDHWSPADFTKGAAHDFLDLPLPSP